MNINLHLLNASGSLDAFIDDIKNNFPKAVDEISKKLDISNIDIVVYDNPLRVIPEYGIGGYSQNANLIFVSLDPKFPNLSKSIGQELKSTLAHEMHHCMRWREVGYGNTLLEALITEGLADHFDLEMYGRDPYPWDLALDKNQIEKFLKKAKAEFNNKDYDHTTWFFGSKNKNIPRWTGYSLGFKIVSDYLQKNPDKKSSSLYNTSAKEFVK
jgi:uncharacterized protein YjaZ